MKEFWVSSGHHMTERLANGGLGVTDALLLTYLARPELVPPPEACEAERELHAMLLADPRRPVTAAMIGALSDEDAQENWRFMIELRDRLIHAPSIEAAYLGIIKSGASIIPPLFLSQLVHLILRNALDGCNDPFVLRAAECFFRAQKASLRDDTLLLADLELIEGLEADRRSLMQSSPLTAMLGQDAVSELAVMTDENAYDYWSMSDAFSMVLNLGGDERSREALSRVIETFVHHLLGLETTVTPIAQIEDADWRWFVGLDAEATKIGNRLWAGEVLDPTEQGRVIALFRMVIADESRVDAKVAGRPIYMIAAVGEDMIWRMKPQNLVAGLPLKRALAA
ncbi:MAG: DUF6352 family protein [Alphaproteobacteria bacterium]